MKRAKKMPKIFNEAKVLSNPLLFLSNQKEDFLEKLRLNR